MTSRPRSTALFPLLTIAVLTVSILDFSPCWASPAAAPPAETTTQVAPKGGGFEPQSGADKAGEKSNEKASDKTTEKTTDKSAPINVVVPAPAPAGQTPEDLFANKEYERVIEQLSPQISSLSMARLKLLGKAYSEEKNPQMAIKVFSMVMVKNPKDYETKTLIGQEQLNTGKDREAMQTLRDTTDLNPKYEPAYLLMEKIYIKKSNKYELRMLYMDMLERIGEKPQYFTRLCDLSTASGLYDNAKAYCRRGIQLQKNEPKNYVFLAVALKEAGDIEEAKSLMRRAAENFPDSEEAQMTYAQYFDEQKDFLDATKYYKQATTAHPESAKAWIGLANASIEIEKFDDALNAYKKACALSMSALAALRHSVNVLRIMKAETQLPKFDALSETCALGLHK